ncbi:MAG: lipocalin family protein [Syntrophobacteraceae bacterium]
MRRKMFVLVLFLSLGGFLSSGHTDNLVQTVSYVDLTRYMGKWYEIASFPNWFQRGCFCSTAEYRLTDGRVTVRNRCRRKSAEGNIETATAKAWAVPNTGNAQLKVQFFWPFRGDYWIIALDEENYQYAMVGHPAKKYLWVLSRTPVMDQSLYAGLVEKALALGYDVSRLEKTDHSCKPAAHE